MPYTLEDYRREKRKELIESLTAEDLQEIARRIPPQDRLAGLSPSDRIAGLTDSEAAEMENALRQMRSQKTDS